MVLLIDFDGKEHRLNDAQGNLVLSTPPESEAAAGLADRVFRSLGLDVDGLLHSDPALAKFSSRVQAVVDVSGPSDFTVEHDPDGGAFLTNFLGASYSTHPEIWQSASARVVYQGQPCPHISDLGSPPPVSARDTGIFQSLPCCGVSRIAQP